MPPARKNPARLRKTRRRVAGSVLVIVLITVIFASLALVVFMEKASNDLIVEQRDAETRRLRAEAYSALEVTLAVLEQFRQVNNGLRSPTEGWNDPLAFAEYTPTDDRKVEIAFEDESGKISLPRANVVTLTNLFKAWELPQTDVEALADALSGWMRRDHVYASGLTPSYEQSAIPYEEPKRSLRSYEELIAIDKVRELFYTEDGNPNDLWKRFADSVSLLDFQRTNINGAKPDALAALGQLDETQRQNVDDFLKGTGSYQNNGPAFFRSPQEAGQVTGPSGDLGVFGATISALRIFVTVHDGQSVYRLAAVVAPPNGATTVATNATAQRTEASAPTARPSTPQQNQPNATQASNNPANRPGGTGAAAADRNLRYPFTLLEIRENDEIPPAPPPPPDPKL